MIYLTNRNITMDSVNLVAVGSGGWVRFWSANCHGLAAEFCIFDHYRRTSFFNREIESVTSCTTTAANNLLLTGDSLGYIMVRNCWCKRCSHVAHGYTGVEYFILLFAQNYRRYYHPSSAFRIDVSSAHATRPINQLSRG